MKEKIKKILDKYPVLKKYLKGLKNRQRFNASEHKKNIIGKENVFDIDKTAILNNCRFDIIGNKNKIVIAESSFFNNVTFYIRGDNNKIIIGQSVRFNHGGSIWMEDDACEAVIGENTTFEDSHIAVTEPNSKITIGKDCLFAYDIDLRTGDSHSIVDSITYERINFAQNISIGNHVWIASHVSVLKGVHISDNSVVATRAVVTKSFVENNILIGGIPAKKIKNNINWDRQRIIKK